MFAGDLSLQTQADERAVVVCFLAGFLLERVEVVGDAEPEHAALVAADVGQVEDIVE